MAPSSHATVQFSTMATAATAAVAPRMQDSPEVDEVRLDQPVWKVKVKRIRLRIAWTTQ